MKHTLTARALLLSLLAMVLLARPALALSWQITTVDSAGSVGLFTSLALDSAGRPHISYFDSTNNDLKYARWDGNSWQTITVDSAGLVGYSTSLALDSLGHPHISYFDWTNNDLKYAHWDGSSWQTTTVDSAGDVGEFTSLALDSLGHPHISYYDRTNRSLKYTRWDGSSWQTTMVESGGEFKNVGWYTSLALDSAGRPHISHFDNSDADLKYARWDGSSWQTSTVDSAGLVGEFTSLALDSLGRPHISYHDSTNNDLKYARWNGSSWQTSTVDSAGNVGWDTSLALDSAGHPHISYHDRTNNDLKYARWDGSSWQTSTVDSAGDVGESTSLALDSAGRPHISYFDLTNRDLKYTLGLLDNTPPLISPSVAGTPGNNGWYASDVTLSWTVVDDESPISSQNGCDPVMVNADTAGITFTCTATSAGGSSSGSVTIKRDATAPTLSAAATSSPSPAGWYNSDVTVHFTCEDGLSGVASCPGDEILSSEGAAVSSTAQTATDQAGNTSAPSNVVTVQIDKTPPVVTVTGVSNGASYPLGSVPEAGCETTDALSGVATPATLSGSGGNPGGTGSFTATCSGALDHAGNSGGASVTYSVLYNWSGFFQPVDNLPTVNTVNAGQAIPVKFSLGGDYRLNIFASGYPKVQPVSCGGNGSDSSSIEETVTAGNSSLQYDPATGVYTYVWKTDKAWGGACRQLVVRLVDGSEHVALFQFNGKGRSADDDGEEALAQQLFLPLVGR